MIRSSVIVLQKVKPEAVRSLPHWTSTNKKSPITLLCRFTTNITNVMRRELRFVRLKKTNSKNGSMLQLSSVMSVPMGLSLSMSLWNGLKGVFRIGGKSESYIYISEIIYFVLWSRRSFMICSAAFPFGNML